MKRDMATSGFGLFLTVSQKVNIFRDCQYKKYTVKKDYY